MHDLTIFGFKGQFAQYFLSHVFNTTSFVGIEKSHEPLTLAQKIAVQESKMVLFCTPYTATQKLLQDLAPIIQPHHTLVDICSVKSNLYNLNLLRAENIISLHPLYSPNSNAKSKHCIQCTLRGSLSTNEVKNHFTMKEMTIDEHDKAMAIVQAGIHFQNYVTAHFLTKHRINAETNLYSILHSVIERQMSQNTEMMAEIQIYNPYVKSTIESLAESFNELRYAIYNQDIEQVKAYIESAKPK